MKFVNYRKVKKKLFAENANQANIKQEYKIRQTALKKRIGKDHYNYNLVFPREDECFTDAVTFLDIFTRLQKKLDISPRNVHAIHIHLQQEC